MGVLLWYYFNMKRKIDDLTLADQEFTRKVLMVAARAAHKKGGVDNFLEGLLTPSEQIMLGRRIWISRLLLEQKTYAEIGARLHVGTTTVAKVELWLLGLMPDYGKRIKTRKRLSNHNKLHVELKQNPFGLTALKKRYPLHFLFFPWPKL